MSCIAELSFTMVQSSFTSFLIVLFHFLTPARGFSHPSVSDPRRGTTTTTSARRPSESRRLRSSVFGDAAATTEARGFAKTPEDSRTSVEQAVEQEDLSKRPLLQIKSELLELLPRMTGQEDEYHRVEQLVNAMEEKYVPAQTLDFLNMAMQGSWQLLFSTNLAGTPDPRKFRLRELVQTVECQNLGGRIRNTATWDLAEAADGNFAATGTFVVECEYTINQGARKMVDLKDHVLRPARGSVVPRDVPGLVGLLHRAMPKEMFDPSDHAVDTTYLDADFRIVRYTGPRLEGARSLFIRQGALEINPERPST